MPSNKLEKLKHLSPLAAAIAFSAAIPMQLQAGDFIVDNATDDETSAQTDLDNAINTIEGEGGGNHTITFASDVTGNFNLNGFDIYGDGSVTIDGAGTTGLTLTLQEGEGWTTVDVNEGGSLEISNLALTIEKTNYSNYNYRPAFYVTGYSELTISNVTIDVVDEGESSSYFRVFEAWNGSELTLDGVHLDAGFEAEGIFVDKSDLTISNSSFTGMASFDKGIEVNNNNESSYLYISISDTTFDGNDSNRLLSIQSYNSYSGIEVSLNNLTFENNYSNSNLVGFYASGYSYLDTTLTNLVFAGNYSDGDLVGFSNQNSANLEATLNSLVFDSNTSDEDSILSVETRVYNSSDESELTLTLTNSTFSGNEANDSIIRLQTYGTESSFSDTESELNALIGNVTLVDNASGSGTLTANANYSNSETDLNLAMAHITMVGNEAEGGSGYSGLNIFRANAYNNDVNVAIINSIISGNSGAYEGDEIDTDIYSNIEIDLDNSLVGANPDADAEEGEGIINGSNNIFGEDPMLNELADNGGSTFTMLPKAGSPVIDAGDADFADQLDVDLGLVFDQRDEERLRGAAPDMGAVEVVPVDEKPTKKKKSDGLFGSVGFGSLMAMFALVGLRRKRK